MSGRIMTQSSHMKLCISAKEYEINPYAIAKAISPIFLSLVLSLSNKYIFRPTRDILIIEVQMKNKGISISLTNTIKKLNGDAK